MTDTSQAREDAAPQPSNSGEPATDATSMEAAPPAEEPARPDPDVATEPAAEDSVAAEASEDGEAQDTEGEAQAAEGEAQAAEGATSGDPEKKKKRRRRRKKGKGDGEAGKAEAKKDPSQVPFLRYFEGAEAGSRRHAFAAGEVVAGRVVRVEGGVTVVDLFGKAVAFADEREPHEVPVLPETPEPGEAAADAPAETAEATESTEGLASAGTESNPPEATDSATSESTLEASAPDESSASVTDEAPPGAEAEHAEADEESEPAESVDPSEPEQWGEPPAVGAIFRGRVGAVSESGHIVLLNRIVRRDLAKKAIEAAREGKQRVEGLVYGFNRGGFDVLVKGIRVFCPASGMSLEPIDAPEPFVGKKLFFTVPPSKGGGGIVVSRRLLLEKELRKKARERMKTLEAGQRLTGRVTQVRDFGVLVDVGEGLEGLVHQSELSWQRGVRPADVVKPGDEVQVEVLKVQPATRKDRHGKLSLSIRATQPDPWEAHAEALTEGSIRKGKVVSTTEFGAFIELAPGIDGLLHISEIGKDLKHAKLAINEGDEVDVVVDRVDRKQRRISLSKLSALEAQLAESGELDMSKRPRSLKPGTHVTVIIDKVEHQGISVMVQGVVGRRGRGFIPNRELTAGENSVDRRTLVPGATLEVKITGIDRDGGLRCSLRARQVDEERQAVQSYRREAAKQGLGTFGDLLRAKLQGLERE